MVFVADPSTSVAAPAVSWKVAARFEPNRVTGVDSASQKRLTVLSGLSRIDRVTTPVATKNSQGCFGRSRIPERRTVQSGPLHRADSTFQLSPGAGSVPCSPEDKLLASVDEGAQVVVIALKSI